ncbi:MAG: tetraacyldisaccharide 4'-kinase [Gammaproteobacteria bacterium]|nr:tetraacyldisaccharide 4'-kinase [Gammaproteobacteria bacterium]
MKRIDACWYSQNPVAWLLLPLAILYCVIIFIRRQLYRLGMLKNFKCSVPVIIVGNISVGGTGKTPLLIALCKLLISQGYRPGVISRGYGGSFEGERQLAAGDSAKLVGDEPCLIHVRTHCPVVVGRDRVAAAELLLKNNNCDVILSDDGLQHYRLQRDIEIAVVDTRRMFGNGYCLPAGPLREPVSRLKQVDLVVDHCSAGESAVSKVNFTLMFTDAINLKTGESKELDNFTGSVVHAVAGIGYPERFFAQLRQAGLSVIEHAYPDHYQYAINDLMFNDDNPVLMTEKDAVKCRHFANDKFWYAPVDAVLSPGFKQELLAKLKSHAGVPHE